MCSWHKPRTGNVQKYIWIETTSEYEIVCRVSVCRCLHIQVKRPGFWNLASEGIHAELNQYSIIICAVDHTFELNINLLLFSRFSLCNKSMRPAHHLGCKPLTPNLSTIKPPIFSFGNSIVCVWAPSADYLLPCTYCLCWMTLHVMVFIFLLTFIFHW